MIAQQYLQEVEEGIVTDYPMQAGFIFRDGSILEIGKYEDHRIISPDEWDEQNIVTYRITEGYSGRELFIRINEGFYWQQYELLKDFLSVEGFSSIFVEVWEDGAKKGFKTFDSYEVMKFLSQLLK